MYDLQTSHAKFQKKKKVTLNVSFWKLLQYIVSYVPYITQTGHTGWLVMFLAEPGQSYVHVNQGVLLAVREHACKEVIPCKFAAAT